MTEETGYEARFIIRATYEDLASDLEHLPKWGELSAELREAMICIYFAGRIDGSGMAKQYIQALR